MATRDRFVGRIAGVGSTSGVRIVIGRWDSSPFGAFTDVMVADRDGTRVLIAPSAEVAEYVQDTYSFDHVDVGPTAVVDEGARWHVTGPTIDVTLTVGARLPLGRLLHAVPAPVATAPAFSLVTNPVSIVTQHGVRTRGTAGNGRRETYGATDLHRVVAFSGTWRGRALGPLAPVTPDPRFGFGSTPRRPSVTTLVTTVRR